MKNTLLAAHLLPTNIDLQTQDTSSPNSLLYGLLGLILIGVIQAIYIVMKRQKETNLQCLPISDAQLN